jgi:hypothetical protein
VKVQAPVAPPPTQQPPQHARPQLPQGSN